MKKRVEINGEMVRRQREKRAWTQEELSERSQLGVRTLRRLEAGQASLDTIKRVTQALAQEPEVPLPIEAAAATHWKEVYESLQVDPLILEISPSLHQFVDDLIRRIGSVRRHIAQVMGFIVPGVRLRDQVDIPPDSYRILVHERVVGKGSVMQGRSLAVGKAGQLESLSGPRTQDPTYRMPGVWIDSAATAEAERLGCMVFDPVSIIATHLTDRIKAHAARLLGVDEVHKLLELLRRPQLVAEVIPGRTSLITLRTVLRNLLEEKVSIRDLGLILERLADCATPHQSPEDLTECVRAALGEAISADYANGDNQISAILIDPSWQKRLEQDWQSQSQALVQRMGPALEELDAAPIVTSAALRRRVRGLFPGQVTLSEKEIATGFQLLPITVLHEV